MEIINNILDLGNFMSINCSSELIINLCKHVQASLVGLRTFTTRDSITMHDDLIQIPCPI